MILAYIYNVLPLQLVQHECCMTPLPRFHLRLVAKFDQLRFQVDLWKKERFKKFFLSDMRYWLTQNFEVNFSSGRWANLVVSSANVDARMMTGHFLNNDRITFHKLVTRWQNIVLKREIVTFNQFGQKMVTLTTHGKDYPLLHHGISIL